MTLGKAKDITQMGDVVDRESVTGESADLRPTVTQYHARCCRTRPSLKHQAGWSGGAKPSGASGDSANVTRNGIEITRLVGNTVTATVPVGPYLSTNWVAEWQ